jgi:hypothetical protein
MRGFCPFRADAQKENEKNIVRNKGHLTIAKEK